MKKLTIFIIAVILIQSINANFSYAQDEDLYPAGNGMYNSAITTPNDFLGYKFGTLHTYHSEMVRYMKTLGEQSDRVMFGTYGETYQKRPLLKINIRFFIFIPC